MRSVNSGCHPLFVSVLYLRHLQILYADFTVVGYSAALLEPPPARGRGANPATGSISRNGASRLARVNRKPPCWFWQHRL